LLDWGVAKVWAMPDDDAMATMEHEELTAAGQRPGTPLYMSPEQVRGQGQIDERTDVYSIGCVLYEMLTLKEPLRGKKINETFDMIINQQPIAPAKRAPLRLIPDTLGEICLRALEKDPDKRFPTMLSLITALRDFRSRALELAST